MLTSVISLGDDQKSKQDVPVVINAVVPLYPRDAQLAHIEGDVHLRVSIDGESVVGVELLQEGQVILVRAAKENVKTWRLKWHERTTFETTFRYSLLPEAVCEVDNPTVLLRLPFDVQVTARSVKTCDPDVEIHGKSGR